MQVPIWAIIMEGKVYERSYEILINCGHDPVESYKILRDDLTGS